MTDRQTIAIYDGQVERYKALVEKQPTNTMLEAFIARLKPADYVLDLGCGPALDAVTMRENGLKVDPMDASQAMVEQANKRFAIGARQAVFTDINDQNKYEGVWASFSLLHASKEDFPIILRCLYHALKPGGLFYLAMKTGEGVYRDKLGRLYSYYTPTELEHHLEVAGFTVQSTEAGEGISLSGERASWLSLLSVSNKSID